jgi:ABC-type antimicrobial peptide transport system permease subunit
VLAILAGAAVLLMVGMIAVYMPARDASKTEPMEALRAE